MGDLISSLPDTLICHILSFLPTKQAVATSVLSKRWMPLWHSVPALDLDDAGYYAYYYIRDKYAYAYEAYTRFVQSVYVVILSRDLNQPIQKFRLSYLCRGDNTANVSLWVNAVVQRRVQHLDLSFRLPSYSKLKPPTNLSSIFTCTTLVVLKLQGIKLEPLSSVDLPLLKVLHLQDLSFSEHGNLAKVLSGCPALEDLKASDLSFHEDVREFKTLPKLLKAHVFHRFYVLRVVSNVKFLHIDKINCSLGEGPGPYVFPVFHNLTHLELVYRYYNNDWSRVVELLEHCPKLQVLVINQPNFHPSTVEGFNEEVGDWQYRRSDPECVLLPLKRCYLNDYRGTKGEFQFARYIMLVGRFLEKMRIRSGLGVNQPEELKMVKKLSSCTRCSATCKLSFK